MTKTITPVMHHTTTITCILTSPFHHGAGASGNTAVLRTQDVIQPDGTTARVPYLSGASVRHALREALAWHTAHTLTWSRNLTKSMVDLLWSGGAVTSTGSQVDLAMARRVDDIYPALGLLGYAAQSDITTGTLRASDLISSSPAPKTHGDSPTTPQAPTAAPPHTGPRRSAPDMTSPAPQPPCSSPTSTPPSSPPR